MGQLASRPYNVAMPDPQQSYDALIRELREIALLGSVNSGPRLG